MNAAARAIHDLRLQLETVVVGTRQAGVAWATGIAALDAALGGGVPRGRITEVTGARGAGRATLVQQAVRRVLESGAWVAWVDACRTAAPHSWVGMGARLVMVRPPNRTQGAWCADVLLRSGVFALVVLDGAPALSTVQGTRLSGLARERDVACMLITDATTTSRLGGAIRLRVERTPRTPNAAQHAAQHVAQHGAQHAAQHVAQRGAQHVAQHVAPRDHRPSRTESAHGFSVIVEKGAVHRTIEVQSVSNVARRVCTNSEIPDRRGVARNTPRNSASRNTPACNTPARPSAACNTASPRGRRRVAESQYGHPARVATPALGYSAARGG